MTAELKQKYAKMIVDEGLEWSSLAFIVNLDLSTDYTTEEVYNRLKRAVRAYKESLRPRLVIPDLHFPFQVDGYLEFLQHVDKKYNCKDQKIQIGDIIDHHALSRHQTEPDADGIVTEFTKAKIEIKKLADAFPNMIVTLGNHDNIPFRQASSLGLSNVHLKSFNEMYELPDTWEVVPSIVLDGVRYFHGVGSTGVTAPLNVATRNMVSTVQGHTHSFAGIKWASGIDRTIFAMNVGCLVDSETYAMAYAKENPNKVSLGCGVVFSDTEAIWIPFRR